jgi:hypothetical protein
MKISVQMLLTIRILNSRGQVHMVVDIDQFQLVEKSYLVELSLHHQRSEVVNRHN